MEITFDIQERPESIWTDGNDPEFDISELSKFSSEERKTLRFLIRPASKIATKEIIERHTKITKTFEFVNGKRTSVKNEEVDWESVQEDQLDHAIESWEGLKTKNGPIQCNKENKMLWANNYPGIAAACVRISLSILSDSEARRIEAQKDSEKNLPSGLNGQPADPKM